MNRTTMSNASNAFSRTTEHNENLNHRITDIMKNLDKIICAPPSSENKSKNRTSIEKEVSNLETKLDETMQITSKTFEALDLHLSKLEEYSIKHNFTKY